MKKTKKSSRRGLEMLSSLITKVIVLCLCMSLAMGTTVFASDDPSASGNGTSTSSDAGGSDGSGNTSGSSDGSSTSSTDNSSTSSTDNSSTSSTDNSSSDGSSTSSTDNSSTSSTDNSSTSTDSSSADNANNAESSNTGTDSNNNAATSNDNADSSNNNADSSNDNADSSNNNADSSNDNAATGNTGTENTTVPAAEQQEGSDGQNQQDAVQEEVPAVEQPAAEPVQGENLPPIETTPEQMEKVDAAIRTYSLMQTTQSQTTEETASEPSPAITSAEALQEAIDAANGAPVTIVIGGDFTLDNTITIPKDANITLVLDGKTLTGSVDTMFKVEGILNVYDKADEIPADQNTGDQNGNSGSTTTETPSVPSSSGSNRGSSKVVVANDTPTTPPESKKGEDAADNSSSLTDAIKSWVEQKNAEPTEGQTQEEKDKAEQEAKDKVDKLLEDVGTITTEKAVSVVFNVVAGGQLKLFGGLIKNGANLTNVTGVKVNSGASFEMSGGVITGMTNSGVIVDKGSATISGDAVIMDNSTHLNGGGISVKNGGTLTMNGGLVAGNESIYDVAYRHNGTNASGSISAWLATGGESGNGGGVAVDNATFEMSGGEIYGNKADDGDEYFRKYGFAKLDGLGGGVYVGGDTGVFNLSGNGTISKNTAGAGGGIFVGKDSNGKDAMFTMKGGNVSGNTALYGEGGGIFINSNKNNAITAGKIMDNETKTTSDLGGGGIYVNSDSKLNIKNAIVTENTANGLGAGLASCAHGRTILYALFGAAIFGNEAKGENSIDQGHNAGGSGWNGSLTDGHGMWATIGELLLSDEELAELDGKGLSNEERQKELWKVLAGNAQDIFAASDKEKETSGENPGIIIASNMLGNFDANWSGVKLVYDENGNLKIEGNMYNETLVKTEDGKGNLSLEKINPDNEGDLVYANKFLGLTSGMTGVSIQDILDAINRPAVIISGNHSNTNGGGIGNNGVLTFGEESAFFKPESVDLKKEITDQRGEQEVIRDPNEADERFSFDFEFAGGVDADGRPLPVEPSDKEDWTHSIIKVNDEYGNVDFNLPDKYYKTPGKYTFIVTERTGADDGTKFDYDKTQYKVVIIVTKGDTEHIQIGDKNSSKDVTTYNVEKVIYKLERIDEDGNEIWSTEPVDSITFNNTRKPEPEDPKDPEDPDTPDPDPTPTPDPDPDPTPTPDPDPTPTPTPDTPDGPNRRPTTPDNTDVDVPDSPTPLAETPEIDIPDPDVPLADTPEIEIPDPDVPLSDVPRTGDAPIVLFGAALFCICGLLLTRLRKITK